MRHRFKMRPCNVRYVTSKMQTPRGGALHAVGSCWRRGGVRTGRCAYPTTPSTSFTPCFGSGERRTTRAPVAEITTRGPHNVTRGVFYLGAREGAGFGLDDVGSGQSPNLGMAARVSALLRWALRAGSATDPRMAS